jgi:hypothetical protein
MKGLLHRLAARAAGTAVPVRSDVRLPFGGADHALGESAETDVVPRHPAASTPVPLREPLAPPETRQPAERVANDRDVMPLPLVDAPTNEASRASKPTNDISIGRRRGMNAHAPSAESIAGRKPHVPQPLLEAIPTIVAQPSVTETGQSLRDAVPSPRRAPDLLLPPATPGSDREPALLMPTHARAQATAPDAPPIGPRAPVWPNPLAPTTASSEPTEVHIHIGRIDVTALHDAAPAPCRQPAATPAPMSLDAYLARRSRS